MTVTHPLGSGASTTISAPFKAKSMKSNAVKAPRRKTVPGGNSQYSVSPPPKQSPLRSFFAVCEYHGWRTAYIKFPCDCEDWNDRCANAVLVWFNMEHRIWCTCQVATMSEVQMMEAIA